jgi:tight adherence protein C
MSPLTGVAIGGGMCGFGLWLAYTAWLPQRPALHVALGRLGQSSAAFDPPPADNIDIRVGRWARKLSLVERSLLPMRADLRILHRSPEQQAASVVTYALLGLLWAPVVGGGGRFIGVRMPLAIPAWLSLIGAALGVTLAIRTVRENAGKRRRTFSHALSGFCDVCVMSLSAGRGIESSLETAAHSGESWPYVELQTALRSGYVSGDTPWDALSRLAADADLPDLAELAAALSLAGDEGASVRDTVSSKSKSIRERLTADAERSAASITERMGVPGVLLVFGFVAFLAFPAISVLFD